MRFHSYIILLFAIILFSCKSHKDAAVTGLDPDKRKEFDMAYYNASKEKILGNLELAAEYYEKCLKLNPNSAAALYELANIFNEKENVRYALPPAKKAAALEPKNEWYSLLLADCYQKTKQYGEAIKVYQNLLKYYPGRVEFYEEIAVAQLYSGKIDDAMKTYDKMEEYMGVNESISLQKVSIYKELHNADKEEKEMLKLIKAFPTEGKYYGMLGEFYMERGQKDKAFENYQKLLQIDPGNGFVHFSLAEYYKELKQNDKAFSEMKIGFANQEIDIDDKVKILLKYYYTTSDTAVKKLADARELCRILAETYPKDAKAFSVYGDFLYRDKQLQEAREQYRKAIELDKSKFALWNQLLLIDSEMNDYESMFKESGDAIEYFPNQPLPYLLKGAGGVQLKQYTEAAKTLKTGLTYVVDNKPLLGQFYATMGDAYNKVPDNKASDEAYEKALTIDSNNVFVLNNYAYYLSLRKEKLVRAEQMSKHSNELSPKNDSYEDTYGWILYQMGKLEEAKKWIEKAMEDGGKNSSVILEHYGDILYKMGDTQKAFEQWRRAKEKGTGSEFLDKKIADKKLYE